MSTAAQGARSGPAEVLAGYMAAAAIFLAALAVVYKPLPLSLAALLLSLTATAIGGRWGNLHAFAVGAATVGFVAGMTVAVITSHALY
jgi:tetrahydromethanopterin S-methyltransferase subunit E